MRRYSKRQASRARIWRRSGRKQLGKRRKLTAIRGWRTTVKFILGAVNISTKQRLKLLPELDYSQHWTRSPTLQRSVGPMMRNFGWKRKNASVMPKQKRCEQPRRKRK